MNLEEAVHQVVNLGEKDPVVVAEKVIKHNDKHWLAQQLTERAADIIAQEARRQINAGRHSLQRRLRPGDQVTSAELKLVGMWIPGGGGFPSWIRAADLTEEHLEARARWLDRLAISVLRQGAWLRDVVALMRLEQAPTLGKLKAALPPMPDDETLVLPALAEAS